MTLKKKGQLGWVILPDTTVIPYFVLALGFESQ